MSRHTREHEFAYGLSLQQEASKTFSKTQFVAAALVLAHLLGIEPSEAETLGLKFTIPDPSILHGGIALVFLHFLFRSLSFAERGSNLFQVRTDISSMRSYIKVHRRQAKGKKTPKEIKKQAKNSIAFYNAVMSPYWIVSTILVAIAFFIALVDVFALIAYIVDNSQFLADAFGYEITNDAGNNGEVTVELEEGT